MSFSEFCNFHINCYHFIYLLFFLLCIYSFRGIKYLGRYLGLRKTKLLGEWRKLHNAELHALYSSTNIIRSLKSRRGGLVAQAVGRSPPTAGVPSSLLGPSMWVSWWRKLSLGRFFTGFVPFSPTTNVIPPFLHTHLIHFVSFHPPL